MKVKLRFGSTSEQLIRDVLAEAEPGIVALGGGALTLTENRMILEERAYRVFIKVSPEQVFDRVRKGRTARPMLGPKPSLAAIEDLYRARMPHYAGADFVVEAEHRSGRQVIDEIAEWIREKKIEIGR